MNKGQHSKFGLIEAIAGYLFLMVGCLFLAPGIGFVMVMPVLLFISFALCKQAPLRKQRRYRRLRKVTGWAGFAFLAAGSAFGESQNHFAWFGILVSIAVVCAVMYLYFDTKIDSADHAA